MSDIIITNKDLAITSLFTELVCFVLYIISMSIHIKEMKLVSLIGVFVFFILFLIFQWRSQNE